MAPTTIFYHIRPAEQGIHWLKTAYQLFAQARLLWFSFCFITAAIELLIASLIPYLGGPLRLILHPIILVGFLATCWQLERGEIPEFTTLFAGFRSNLYALIPLGVLNFLVSFLILFASQGIDGGFLWDAAVLGKKVDAQSLESSRLVWTMLAVIIAFIPYLLAFWFAPALIVFDDLNAFSALRVSLAAGFANWRAFLVYASIFTGMAIVLSILATLAQIFLGSAGVALIGLLTLAIAITAIPVGMAAFYTSYRDVFHPDTPMLS